MRKITIILIVTLACLALTSPVLAKPHLSFTVNQVYWSAPYRIAVEGYFHNDGSQTITGITYFNLDLYYLSGGNYRYLTRGTWVNDEGLRSVYLFPGNYSNWTFYIDTSIYPTFNYWRYESYAEYNYLR